MRSGRTCGPPPPLGGVGPREGAHGGACHPQTDLVKGAPLLTAGIWGERALQQLPPTPSISEERVALEPLPDEIRPFT